MTGNALKPDRLENEVGQCDQADNVEDDVGGPAEFFGNHAQ